MSIEFARTHILSRSGGHSAVKAAAYRAGERLYDARIGLTVDYSHRASEVRHTEILLPEGGAPALLDRETLWRTVEEREDRHNRRASAQLAKDHILALPRELSNDDQVALARAFAHREFVSKGLVVDLAVHDHSAGNPHAHLMTTTRVLEGGQFTDKARALNGQFYAGQRLPEAEQIRHRWAAFQNAWFLERGIDAHVHNHGDEGYSAEVHLGPANAMAERGVEVDLSAINHEIRDARTRVIVENPSIVIDRVSSRKSLFTRHDLYREAATLVDDPDAYRILRAKLDVEPSLRSIRVELEGSERSERGEKGKTGVQELLTTQGVLDLETAIRDAGARLGEDDSRFGIPERSLAAALDERPMLSDEQRAAARNLVESNRLGIVVGLAGAGKSTMLDAVRAAYTDTGHRVQGLALAGKAADELGHSASIESRTIASWLMSLDHGREQISAGDVYVMDEAGMVDNGTMKRVLDAVEQGGAKLVLVGDGEQLQAIRAGCPFRDLAKQEGFTEIATIRRQKKAWMREATAQLARDGATTAVTTYRSAGHVHEADGEETFRRLVEDYLAAPEASKTILAHRRVDVATLNAQVRAARQAAGEIEIGRDLRRGVPATEVLGMPIDLEAGDRIRFEAADPDRHIVAGMRGTYLGESDGVHTVESDAGRRSSFTRDEYDGVRHGVDEERFLQRFAAGDRVLFTKNDRNLGVKNGMLGELVGFAGTVARVRTDDGQTIDVDDRQYPHLEYGYATTIHKAQGMTVDRAFVLGSGTMDKHLGYVAMSRHRERLDVYLPSEQFQRRSFEEVISKARRQESALDLVREHGLEPERSASDRAPIVESGVEREAEHGARERAPIVEERTPERAPEPVPERSMSESTPVVESVTERENVERAQPEPEPIPLERAGEQDAERTTLDRAFEAASRVVDAAAAANLARHGRDARATFERLDGISREARQALAQHDAGEPRQGLLGSATKHREWSDAREVLERALGQATNAAIQHRREELDDPQRDQVVARSAALREHPEAAETLELHKRRVEALEQRYARAVELEIPGRVFERGVEREPAEPEPIALDRAELEDAFEAASRVVDAAAAANLARHERDARATFERLEDVSRAAREALARHDAAEPRQGLLGRATKHREWSDAREGLERALGQATNAAIQYRRKELDDPQRNQVVARNAALREHANAARTLQLRARVRSGETAHARFVQLEARRAGQNDDRERLDTERELKEITQSLSRNADFLRTLDRGARQDLERVQTRSAQAIALDRDRGRGMSR